MDRQVEQIHACLADAIQRSRPRPFETPVTVAEIYQDLVPYRSVRARIGFEMNADYEHTLLRLLAGEGELARLEPPEARDELRAELSTANPNVGLFRKFAACDVWIVAPREGVVLPAMPEPVAATLRVDDPIDAAFDAWESRSNLWRNAGEPIEDAFAEEEEEPLELLLEEEDVEAEAVSVAIEEPRVEAAAVFSQPQPKPEETRVHMATKPNEERSHHHAEHGQCAFCNTALPRGRTIRFCPFCGVDQTLIPCVACGEALEPTWLYCIACGAAAPPQMPQ
jgi:hypothetical protein